MADGSDTPKDAGWRSVIRELAKRPPFWIGVVLTLLLVVLSYWLGYKKGVGPTAVIGVPTIVSRTNAVAMRSNFLCYRLQGEVYNAVVGLKGSKTLIWEAHLSNTLSTSTGENRLIWYVDTGVDAPAPTWAAARTAIISDVDMVESAGTITVRWTLDAGLPTEAAVRVDFPFTSTNETEVRKRVDSLVGGLEVLDGVSVKRIVDPADSDRILLAIPLPDPEEVTNSDDCRGT